MINKDLIEKIEDFNFWHKNQETGLKRKELDEVFKFVDDKEFVLAINGVRRAGKTYLSKQILKEKLKQVKSEQTLYVNFEDPSLEPYLNVESLKDIYETYRYFLNKKDFAYVVFDEIQNVPKWEKWIRIMLEKKEKAKFIITGSSSKFFRNEFAKVLTGRVINFSLFPLSFKNFLDFKNYKIKGYETFESFSPLINEYFQYGGFPLVVLEKDEDKKNIYLKELFNDILIKDIITKYKLRELEIKKLAVLLLDQFSSLTSVRRLQNLIQTIARTKISPTSINKYLYYFSEAFLFFYIPIFSYKVKEIIQYPKKVYSIDLGLINAINLKFSENIGRLCENVAAIKLLKDFGEENLFYWKNQNKEVDFMVKEKLKIKQLIQVCYDIKEKKARKREISGLLKASEELKCNDLLVLTWDFEGEEKIYPVRNKFSNGVKNKKIKFLPLWKWLLIEAENRRI